MTDARYGLADRFCADEPALLGELYDLYVFVNGKFVKGGQAAIPIWDHGLLYGDGVFEGIRAYQGSVFKLDEHLDRLLDSMRALDITLDVGRVELSDVIFEVLRRNHLRNAHIRVVVTRGIGRPGLDPRKCKQPSVIVMAYPFPPLLGRDPISVISASIRRKAPYAVDAKIKSLNYLDSILAKLQAIAAGVDDAIILDLGNCIAEATGENVFTVKNAIIATPPPTAALPGITRATVIDLARSMGYAVEERVMTMGDLYTADEIFLTGTAAEIAPVGEVDGRLISRRQLGPVTARISEAYQDLVSSGDFGTPIPRFRPGESDG